MGGGVLSVSLPSREEGGAAGREEEGDGGTKDGERCSGEEASAITVTSPLLASTFGDGERDFGQGGSGDPPVEEPSGDGRSMEGEGEGEGDLGDGGGIVELGLGDDGWEAPGEIDVGRGRRAGEWTAGRSVSSPPSPPSSSSSPSRPMLSSCSWMTLSSICSTLSFSGLNLSTSSSLLLSSCSSLTIVS